MKKYDVIIVGAGPGGIFSAYELVTNNSEIKVAVFEKGHLLEKRKCPIDGKKVKSCVGCKTCAIMNGFGGAGAFSDGKYNITNQFGGNLYEYIGKQEALDLMHYVDEINLSHGGEGTALYSTANTEIKKLCLTNGLHLLDASVRHLGTDINYVVLENLYQELKEKKKKEKPEKEDKPSVSEKKLSPKKILPIVVVCISLGAVILLLGNFLADYTAKRSGREAYYAGDYQTCYQNLMGKELDETEQVMYSQSESILTIRMWLREYEVFVNEGSELEALDSLLQAVRDYPTLLNYATQWNAQDEVSLAFQDILNILSQKYQLSQEEAQQIADISDNVEYTKNVMLVLQRLGLGFWEFPQGTVTEETSAPNTEEAPAQLPDPLPEEEEIQQ